MPVKHEQIVTVSSVSSDLKYKVYYRGELVSIAFLKELARDVNKVDKRRKGNK